MADKKETFKETLENNMIPLVRSMIRKEEHHLAWLNANWRYMRGADIDSLILNSESALEFFNLRLKEYEDVLEK